MNSWNEFRNWGDKVIEIPFICIWGSPKVSFHQRGSAVSSVELQVDTLPSTAIFAEWPLIWWYNTRLLITIQINHEIYLVKTLSNGWNILLPWKNGFESFLCFRVDDCSAEYLEVANIWGKFFAWCTMSSTESIEGDLWLTDPATQWQLFRFTIIMCQLKNQTEYNKYKPKMIPIWNL